MKYALLLNDMRSSNIENIIVIKISSSKEELANWYRSLLVTPYIESEDGRRWGKTFKKGSELEWFNSVQDIEKLNDYWGGIWEVNDNVMVGMGLGK